MSSAPHPHTNPPSARPAGPGQHVLVVAPHPDDEVLGCAGAICQHRSRGDTVSAVFLTSGELGLKELPREKAWEIRENEARAAARILRLAQVTFLRGPDWALTDALDTLVAPLRELLVAARPDVIYLPHPQDEHPDHEATLPLLRRALTENPKPGETTTTDRLAPSLRAYEVWTPLHRFDLVVDLTPWMTRKLRALRAHRSQLAAFDYIRAIRGLNQYRGALAARRPYAEVYQTLSLKPS